MNYYNGTAWITIAPTANDGAHFTMTAGVPSWTGGTPPLTVPDAPTITGVVSDDGQATVSFKAPSSDGGSLITTYTATSNPEYIIGTLSQSGTGSLIVTGLTNGTAYTFTVTATNDIGTSSASVVSTLVTPDLPPPPTVESSTGRIWMDRNLGATQVATSSTDAASYGDLYQWGRDSDGHQIRTSNVISTIATSAAAGHDDFIDAGIDHWVEGGSVGEVPDGNWTNFSEEDTLWQSGLNDPCPKGFRIPTEAEWQDEINTWTNTNKAQAAMNSELKLPLAGYRLHTDGTLGHVGEHGDYWSSTVSDNYAGFLYFGTLNGSSSTSMYNNNRALAFSVRCIQK
jgi:uncharacterized protein (TIGR02145 family)